jgi:hypothetical protein
MPLVKERRSEKELRQMMLAAARKHEECSELEDLFIFGPTPRPGANWGIQKSRPCLKNKRQPTGS